MADQEQKNYSDNVKKKFSESLYQHMASKRFGIDFCCNTAKELWKWKNNLLNLNNIADAAACKVVCPSCCTPEEEENTCVISCLNLTSFCDIVGIEAYQSWITGELVTGDRVSGEFGVLEKGVVSMESLDEGTESPKSAEPLELTEIYPLLWSYFDDTL